MAHRMSSWRRLALWKEGHMRNNKPKLDLADFANNPGIHPDIVRRLQTRVLELCERAESRMPDRSIIGGALGAVTSYALEHYDARQVSAALRHLARECEGQ